MSLFPILFDPRNYVPMAKFTDRERHELAKYKLILVLGKLGVWPMMDGYPVDLAWYGFKEKLSGRGHWPIASQGSTGVG
jgi:hypothetical protein